MPQLDPSSFGSQLFWLFVCFGTLFFLMACVALPRIGRTLSNRQAQLDDDLAAAENLRAEAEAALAAYEKALAEARSKALIVAQEIRAEIQAETDRRKAALDAKLAVEAADADARLAAARKKALSGLKAAAQDIVGDVMTGLGVSRADKAAISKAVDEAGA